nr:hypothetical protein L203_03053 [Cryptococcus depauperatus CBS 7841]
MSDNATGSSSQSFQPVILSSKTLPPPSRANVAPGVTRKQNIACDQCRTRKIRCLRADRTEICEQCKTRKTDCTSNYIDALQEKKKSDQESGNHKRKRRRKSDDSPQNQPKQPQPTPLRALPVKSINGESRGCSVFLEANSFRSSTPETRNNVNYESTSDPNRESANVSSGEGLHKTLHTAKSAQTIASSLQVLAQAAPSHGACSSPALLHRLVNSTATGQPLTSREKQQNLIQYMLSPYSVQTYELGYTDWGSIELCKRGESDLWEEMDGYVWDEEPTEAHKSIDEDGIEEQVLYCCRLIDDFIDGYFSIAHPRHPCYDPPTFRARFVTPNSHPSGCLPHPILATALAWGARFSEHPIIQSDMQECREKDVAQGRKGRKRSRLIQMIVIRAREVCETWKVYRIASMDNVRALINLEGLLGHLTKRKGYQVPYASAAIKHLIAHGYNSSHGVATIQNDKERTETISLWWHIVLADGYRSVFYRLKPCLLDEDYDIEPPRETSGSISLPNGLDTSSGNTWFMAAQSGASMCRSLSLHLFSPRSRSLGIPLSALRIFTHSASLWRSSYLPELGVLSSWPADWDFLQAISACTLDACYHALWLALDQAVYEFGVEEEKRGGELDGAIVKIEIDSIKKRIQEESRLSAMRIAALAAILTENGYLRLDTGMMHYPIHEAGLHLARQNRSECLACIVGLKQYSNTFPAVWEQAEALEEIYAANAHPSSAKNQFNPLASPNLPQPSAMPSSSNLEDIFKASWPMSSW